jgi:hypothetical protein
MDRKTRVYRNRDLLNSISLEEMAKCEKADCAFPYTALVVEKQKTIVWTKVFAIRLLHMYLLRKLGQVTLIRSFDNTSSQSLELSQC